MTGKESMDYLYIVNGRNAEVVIQNSFWFKCIYLAFLSNGSQIHLFCEIGQYLLG